LHTKVRHPTRTGYRDRGGKDRTDRTIPSRGYPALSRSMASANHERVGYHWGRSPPDHIGSSPQNTDCDESRAPCHENRAWRPVSRLRAATVRLPRPTAKPPDPDADEPNDSGVPSDQSALP